MAEHLRKRGTIWYATIYDAHGVRREASTGCTSKAAARAVLERWEREAASPDNGSTTLNDALSALLEDRRARVREGRGSEHTVRHYEVAAGHLVRHFGHEYRIAHIRDTSGVWGFIDAERRQGVKDAAIRKALVTLRAALRLAVERGVWSGVPAMVIPDSLRRAQYAPRSRSPKRDEVAALLPHLPPDTAAAVAFILATTAESAALALAQRTDIPARLDVADLRVRVRGTKNDGRDRMVPIITDEQRLLLEYARQHAQGSGARLFGPLANIRRDLQLACEEAKIAHLSPHDLRRAAGQWLIDLRMPLELVSLVMGHRDLRVTQQVYARVREEDLGSRMLDAISPDYAQRAVRARGEAERVATLTSLPAPRTAAPVLYAVGVTSRTLAEWARATGIGKSTLHHRVVTRGLSMAHAIALGKGGRGRPLPAADASRVTGSNCRTGAADTVETAALLAHSPRMHRRTKQPKTPAIVVSGDGIEPPTRGFSILCSTD